MDLYSTALLVAIVLSGAALAVASAARFPGTDRRLPAIARWCGLSALAAGLYSALHHLVNGHLPGTAMTMGWIDFFRYHPAFVVVVVSSAGALALAHRKGVR